MPETGVLGLGRKSNETPRPKWSDARAVIAPMLSEMVSFVKVKILY